MAIRLVNPRSMTSKRSKRGVALVEVILAALLLGIGLSVSLSLASTAIARQGLGERQLVAAWLADEQMNLVLMEGAKQYIQSYETSGRFDSPFEDFSYEVTITHVADLEPYEVEVIILWDDGRQSFQLESLVAPREDVEAAPEDRIPLEPIDREAIYYEDIVE